MADQSKIRMEKALPIASTIAAVASLLSVLTVGGKLIGTYYDIKLEMQTIKRDITEIRRNETNDRFRATDMHIWTLELKNANPDLHVPLVRSNGNPVMAPTSFPVDPQDGEYPELVQVVAKKEDD